MTVLRWIASSEASALHAAAALAAGGRIVDARLDKALGEPAVRLAAALRELGLPLGSFFQHAIPLACQADETDPAELARLAIRNATEREWTKTESAPLAVALAELFAAQVRVFPDMDRELQVRGAVLAEQWEARGPGLLAAIGRMTDRSLIPAEVAVALVYPAQGGGGAASLTYSLVRIEAVLANPHAALPEVARLGWLISQLGFSATKFSGGAPTDRPARLAALAMAPAALAAAEYVELAHCDLPTLTLALDAWGLADDQMPDLAKALFSWWNAWRAAPGEWGEAIASMDSLLDMFDSP